MRTSGTRLGNNWASTIADLNHLECLEIFHAYLLDLGIWETWFRDRAHSPFTIAERFHFAVIDPHGVNLPNRIPLKINQRLAAQFWKSVGATEAQTANPEFLMAFVEAALQTWQRAKTKYPHLFTRPD